jgi:ketosteroid isomerase-like protein
MAGDEVADAATLGVIRAKVARMSALLAARDPAIVDELWSPGFRLVGSEHGEIAEDRPRLERLFAMLFARPVAYGFDFTTFAVGRQGDIAWLFADGHILAQGATETARHPYRLTAVFQRRGEDWQWRLYCGAEPAGPPA